MEGDSAVEKIVNEGYKPCEPKCPSRVCKSSQDMQIKPGTRQQEQWELWCGFVSEKLLYSKNTVKDGVLN